MVEARHVVPPGPAVALARAHLTEVEIAILQWLSNGKRLQEIAELLEIRSEAVAQHVFRIKDKTGTATIGGSVAFGIRKGFIK